MNDLLNKIVQRQRVELKQLAERTSVLREKTKDIIKALNSPLIKVVTGPRRAGKSSLVIQALEDKQFAYLNFEDEMMPRKVDGDEILKALKSVYGAFDFIFFDEIQNLEKWEVLLNRLHRLGINIVVTGSNAKLLSQEFASSLTGRNIQITLLPFSFSEFQAAKKHSNKKSIDKQENGILEYLKTGGFPEVVMSSAEQLNYSKSLFESIVIRDIVQRYKIRNIAAIRELFKLYIASIGNRFSGRSLERGMLGKLSIATIQKYLSYAMEAYLIQDLEVFSLSTRSRMKSDRKAYTIDNGFYRSLHVSFEDNMGILLENAVFIELLRRGNIANENLFYIDCDKSETDFFLSDSSEIIQVTASMRAEKTRERELKAILKAAAYTAAKRLTIVTMNEKETFTMTGRKINVIPAYEWFL
jgi:uncharacterized protein